MHTYHDGMKLLIGVLLVNYVGGFAGIATWLFVGITIFSWLYAPFLFNPYQFSKQYFMEDLQSWVAFFLKDGSKHWVDWYDQTQLRPRRGFRQSVWDIKAFIACFVLLISFSIFQLKSRIFSSVYATPGEIGLESFALLPPMILSSLYCISISLVEALLSCVCKRRRESARSLGGGVCDSAAETDTSHTCRMPLIISAFVVVALEMVELVAPLHAMRQQGWYKAFVSGLLYKLIVFSLLLFMAEGLLKSRCFARLGRLGRAVDLFVHANRLAKDLVTSLFLFCTLAVGVLLNTFNDALCPSFNLHQLLVYRARPLRLAAPAELAQ